MFKTVALLIVVGLAVNAAIEVQADSQTGHEIFAANRDLLAAPGGRGGGGGFGGRGGRGEFGGRGGRRGFGGRGGRGGHGGGGGGGGFGRAGGRGGNGSFEGNRGGCGGYKQGCCANSHCNYGLRCLTMGDSDWVGMAKRCLPVKRRGRCGTDGLSCCRGKCIRGLTCAGQKMCRKPSDSIRAPQGQTTAQLTGWVMVKVLARGGKCFVKVNGNINTSVTTFGEGTFGETFGDLNALGECAEGASGYGIGYIRADVLATAIRGPDGECITTSSSEINSGAKVNGEGILIGVGGEAGATVGCNRRKLTLADFLN